ncbi:DegT/DnrJ/EryC1/StrS family aminotransferase [bacterium]|nr:DegT/DnrJ/EryC1/StrS family aminotransferase [bacterium]
MTCSNNSTDNKLPAIAGGSPAKSEPFGSGKRYLEEEMTQLREVLDQGTLFYAHGKKVHEMEQRFTQIMGTKYAVATSSGTASIHAAMMAAGISPGDEVIVTPITDMGSLVPILWQGAVPIFADVDPHSYVIDPKSVEKCITDKTRAVLAVHLWGNACDLNAMKPLCDEHGIFLIEDCAQAWGCTYDEKYIGTIGDMGCFSLNEFKHISCGDGGVVITNDDNLARRLRLSTDKCYDREPGKAMRRAFFLANNYRMTELQGAVALAQSHRLESIVSKRRSWATKLNERLSDVKGIFTPKPTAGCDPSWWFYMLRIDPTAFKANTDEFAKALQAEGLGAGAHYIAQCVYEYPIFADHSAFDHGDHPFSRVNYGKGMCPMAESVLETAITLPVNENFTDKDLEETVEAIVKVADWFRV